MDFTPEQYSKAKASKSLEELFSYANELGYKLTEDEAKRYFDQWHKEGELADEELENVAGGSFPIGCSTYSSDPPYYMVTTTVNECEHYSPNYHFGKNPTSGCEHCAYRSASLTPLYCLARTAEHDPLNPKVGGGYYNSPDLTVR